jgi:hypothetical protein
MAPAVLAECACSPRLGSTPTFCSRSCSPVTDASLSVCDPKSSFPLPAAFACACCWSAQLPMNCVTASSRQYQAGAAKLMTEELIATLCDHAQGNLRALMNMAGELLAEAAQREAQQIDERLFLEMTSQGGETKPATGRRR